MGVDYEWKLAIRRNVLLAIIVLFSGYTSIGRVWTNENGVGMASTLHDLFDAHKRMLWGLAYRLTGRTPDADDIVQDTFVRAIHRGSFT